MPVPIVTSAVPSANTIPPDAQAAGTRYTAPLAVRGYGSANILLQLGVLGSSATVDAKIQESDDPSAILNNLDDAQDTGLGLRLGATDNAELAAFFTTPAGDGVTVKEIKVKMKGVGTLASGKVVTATLQVVTAGVPDDTDLFTPVAGDLAPDEISTSEYVTVTFTVPAGVHLAAATQYAVVIEGDYSASGSNYLLVGVDTVGSGGNVNIHDTDWGAVVTTQTMLVNVVAYDWTDISGAAFSQKLQASSHGSNNYIGTIALRKRLPFLRGLLTVGTATSDVAMQILLHEPDVRPGGTTAEFTV